MTEYTEACPDCHGSGVRDIPIYNDWDEIEYWTQRTCSFCGGEGNFLAEQAMELRAEGYWYDGSAEHY
jgi:DnaJ-class molecular chaperone